MSADKNILNELENLIKHQVISVNTAEKIRTFYQLSPQTPSKKIWSNYILSLGFVFVALGILFLIAYNLPNISKYQKLSLAIILLVSTQIATYFFVLKNKTLSILLQETIVLVYCLVLGGSLILINQTFTFEGSMHTFLFIWLALILPITYLKPLNAALLIYNLVLFFWLFSFNKYDNHLLILPILIASIPPVISKFRQSLKYAYIATWLFSLNIYITCMVYYDKFTNKMFLQFAILLAILFIQIALILPTKISLASPFRKLGYLLSHFLLLFATTTHSWWWSNLKIADNFYSNLFLGFLFLSNLICAIFLWRKKLLNPPLKIFMALPLTIVFLLIFAQNPIHSAYISLPLSLHLLILYLTYIQQGFKNLNKSNLNWGMLGVIMLIMLKVFDYDLSFLTKGLIFIILGVSFILTNKALEKKQGRDLYD